MSGLMPDLLRISFDRLRPMFREGVRYFCAPDHLIPPEVPLALFRYFIDRLRREIESGEGRTPV